MVYIGYKGTNTNMNAPTLFAIIVLAAIIHASFQLSVSVLTLVSGHALGAATRRRRVMNLLSGFTLGAMTMTLLMLATLAYVAYSTMGNHVPPLVWAVVCGLMAGVAVAIWVFYYRRGPGTALWLPRPMAYFLHNRVKSTELTAEAFSLGLTSVIAEILFAIAPLGAAACAMVMLPRSMQIVGLITYTIITTLPLLSVVVLVGGGRRLSTIQKWRDTNKRFIQFVAGAALFVLAFYIYVNAVLAPLWLKVPL